MKDKYLVIGVIIAVILFVGLIVIQHYKEPCYDMCSNPQLSFVLYHKFCVEGSPSFNHNFYEDYHNQLNECRSADPKGIANKEKKHG